MKLIHIMNERGQIVHSYIREDAKDRFYVSGSGKLFYGKTFHGKPSTPLYIHTWDQFVNLSKNGR